MQTSHTALDEKYMRISSQDVFGSGIMKVLQPQVKRVYKYLEKFTKVLNRCLAPKAQKSKKNEKAFSIQSFTHAFNLTDQFSLI